MTLPNAAVLGQADRKLSWWQMGVYSLPVAPVTILAMPIATILPAIYAKHFGLSLITLGTIVMVSRVVDAICDPLIGIAADRWSRRSSRPTPFLIAGALLLAASGLALFQPPASVTVAYAALAIFTFYIGWSIFEIPHTAWGGRLAHAYADRARLFGVRTAVFYVGSVAFFALPMLVGIQTIDLEALRFASLVAIPPLAVGVVLILLLSPSETPPPQEKQATVSAMLKALTGNRPFLLFLSAFLLAGLGFGMWAGLLFLALDVHLGLSTSVAGLFALTTPMGLLGVLLWTYLGSRFGKSLAWAICTGLNGALMLAMAFIEPGPTALYLAGGGMLGVYLASSGQFVLPNAILADIADYGRWKFGIDQMSTYYAVLTFFVKSVSGIGTGAGLWIAGNWGFDASAPAQSEGALLGLKLGFGVVPAALLLCSIIPMLSLPITAKRHRAIRRRLDRRLSELAAKP